MNPDQNKDRMFSIEQSLIAALLVFDRAIDEVIVGLDQSHFANKTLGGIYDVIRTLDQDGIAISPTSVGKCMRDRGYPKPKEAEEYLDELWGSSATAANASWCSLEIRKDWQTRTAATDCGEAALALRADGANHVDIIDKLQGKLEDVVKCSQPRGPRPMGQDLKDIYLNTRQAAESGGVGGVSTGFSRLDWWTGGLQRTNLVVLAAQTGIGKTSLAMNIAANVARSDEGVVVIFSMEMGRSELAGRLVASEMGLDLRKLAVGNLSEDDWARFETAQHSLGPMVDRIYLDVSGSVTPTIIRASLRRIQRRETIALVIVDYLQLCGTGVQTESQYARISTISGALKAVAVDFDVPVLALSQLSREAARRNGEPRLSDLRDSGTIEQDANVVVFIHRKSAKDSQEEEAESATIIVAKNRNGPTGKFSMRWAPHHVRFSDLKGKLNTGQGELL